jgi:protein gp37
MGENSKIEWTDATWNPWQGCTKVSPACDHCYMFRDLGRYGKDPTVVFRSKPLTFDLPIRKRRGGEWVIEPGKKVFTCSWSDWFHKDADAWRPEAWEIIRRRPDLTFQIVTKRVERIAEHLPADWGKGWPNVWLIVTVENQEFAETRIPKLIEIPAAVRGLSIEPMLGPISFRWAKWQPFSQVPGGATNELDGLRKLDWVICGGESGLGARPMNPDWARSLRDQCVAAGVPFHFKQWGEWAPREIALEYYGADYDLENEVAMARIGKKAAGRLLDGREHNEFPKVEVAT